MEALIYHKQRVAVERLLHFDQDPSEEKSITWKVLVFDRFCRDVITPLFRVGDIRDHGVTLHLQLEKNRHRIPDVPALYFVSPTEESVDLIIRDFEQQLYESVYVNFCAPVPRPLLERLALGTIQQNAVSSVKKVFDQYLSFICMEKTLFALHSPSVPSTTSTYQRLHDPRTSDPQMEANVDALVGGLFSVIVTLGVIPVIMSSRGGPSEMIATKLDEKLREYSMSNASLFDAVSSNLASGRPGALGGGGGGMMMSSSMSSPGIGGGIGGAGGPGGSGGSGGSGVGGSGGSGSALGGSGPSGAAGFLSPGGPGGASCAPERPVLLVLDRNIDLSVCLHHPWSYRALVHDVLGMQMNRVNVEIVDDTAPAASSAAAAGSSAKADALKQPAKKQYSYDLDPARDPFWQSMAGCPFDQVTDEVNRRLAEYKERVADINRRFDVDVDVSTGNVGDSTKDIASTIQNLPELREMKKRIDMHTNIAVALMNQIKQRKLDVYCALTEQIAMGRGVTDLKREFQQIFTPDGPGTLQDKLRLFLIYFLLTENPPKGEVEKLSTFLEESGANMSSFFFLKKSRSMMGSIRQLMTASNTSGGGGRNLFVDLTSKFQKVAEEMKQNVASLVKGSATVYPVTRILDAVMEMKQQSTPEAQNLLYLDPKVVRSDVSVQQSSKFRDAIVFMVGGGNYLEYQNLLDYIQVQRKNSSPKTVLYGCTEMVSGEQFLNQFSELGQIMQPTPSAVPSLSLDARPPNGR